MQGKLAMWSTENKERKFERLLRLIADRTWLAEAARITLASSGARTPGVDGVDKDTMEGNLPSELDTSRTVGGLVHAAAGAARVHTEGERQAEAIGYPKLTGSHCAKSDADGHGTDLGE
jgi:hypothetical protein